MFPWLKDSWLKLLKVYNGTHAPNSILIYGKDGLGKKEIARELASFYLCFNKNSAGYCGSCPSCLNMAGGTHGDFLTISSDNGSQIGIEEIRDMIETMSMSAKMQHGKVVIIENIELLTLPAANALLKILEEPAADLLFILTADNLLKIIPTILSRCVKFKINDPDYQLASSWMREQITDKSVDLKHFFLLNNYSPVDTVRFINSNQHHLIYALIYAIAEFLADGSKSGAVIECLQNITDTSPFNKADDDPKAKKKGGKIIFSIVYPWLYFIVSDIYRSRLTGSLKENYFLKSEQLLARFRSVPVHVLHESLELLTQMARENQILATSYLDLHIVNWLQQLARR